MINYQCMNQEFYTIGQVAWMLKVDTHTLKAWIKRCKVPNVIRRDKRGWRLFTKEDIEYIKLCRKGIDAKMPYGCGK